MAIGLARAMNIRFPLNFDSPYQARDISAFWRRWHMTLGAFLRDYVYIPLGGSRQGEQRRIVNLLMTMLLVEASGMARPGGSYSGAACTDCFSPLTRCSAAGGEPCQPPWRNV